MKAAAPDPAAYLCVPTSNPFNFSFNSAGPLRGKKCVMVHEFAAPHTWSDNYLYY